MVARSRWGVLLLVLFAIDGHALTHTPAHSKIISRKGDGQISIYSFDDVDEEKGLRNCVERNVPIGSRYDLRRFKSALRSTFLPILPNDQGTQLLKSTGYLRYVLYDNIQDLSTSLRSVLATQRILEGVGVGREGATALSATLNFLIRDGTGMVASLLFTSSASRSFRRNIKRWRFFADCMVDIGITLEIVAPSLPPKWFLPILCAGNICKALCGVAAGACGGALQMYWANQLTGTEEGISEVAAKTGAQRTVMGGAGLVFAAFLAKWLGSGDGRTAVGLYCLLTLVHLITNYRALKLVGLDWLNGWRLHLLVEEFLAGVAAGVPTGAVVLSNPLEASRREPLLFLPRMATRYRIRNGISFNEFMRFSCRIPPDLMDRQSSSKSQDSYVLAVGRQSAERLILIAYFSQSTNEDKVKAYLHACLAGRALASLEGQFDTDLEQKAEELSKKELAELWPVFYDSVSSVGWKLSKTECATEGYECSFET